MLFNSASFCAFFFVFYVLYYFVSKNHTYKLWLITIASLLFYGLFNYKFVPILIGTGLVDFYLAMAIADSKDAVRRKRLVTLSVAMNLAVLAFFKYTNFFLATVQDGVGLFHGKLAIKPLDIVVPLGISFYTFQSISYTIDVYRKNFQPRRRVLEFIASLTFFPHLVAGPIIRSSLLLPQFEKFSLPAWSVVQRGLLLIAAGLAKKTIADVLAPVAEGAFTGDHVSAIDAWSGVLAFTGQIYGDFAGYTDIAIGISALLGFNLPQNFNLPYLSTSPADFWRRWHISLSSWLRDYVYMPMVLRNRKVYRDLFITMVLCGIWHGANWTFLLFGVYHGTLVVVDAFVVKRIPRDHTFSLPVRVGQVLFTLYLMTIGFVFFRATSLPNAWRLIRDLHHSPVPSLLTFDAVGCLVLTVCALIGCHLVDYVILHVKAVTGRAAVMWTLAVLLMAISFAFGTAGAAFIYFQF